MKHWALIIQKQQYRSAHYGIIDSKVQKSLGIKIDKQAAVLESLKQMGYLQAMTSLVPMDSVGIRDYTFTTCKGPSTCPIALSIIGQL